MEFNPLAVVVFLIGGMFLYASGLNDTPVATLFFFRACPSVANQRLPVGQAHDKKRRLGMTNGKRRLESSGLS